MTPHDTIFFVGAIAIGFVVVAGAIRLARGPSTLDRLLALDTLIVSAVGLVVLHSVRERTAEYIELILVVTALGFFTTVAFFYYLSQSQSGPDSKS